MVVPKPHLASRDLGLRSSSQNQEENGTRAPLWQEKDVKMSEFPSTIHHSLETTSLLRLVTGESPPASDLPKAALAPARSSISEWSPGSSTEQFDKVPYADRDPSFGFSFCKSQRDEPQTRTIDPASLRPAPFPPTARILSSPSDQTPSILLRRREDRQALGGHQVIAPLLLDSEYEEDHLVLLSSSCPEPGASAKNPLSSRSSLSLHPLLSRPKKTFQRKMDNRQRAAGHRRQAAVTDPERVLASSSEAVRPSQSFFGSAGEAFQRITSRYNPTSTTRGNHREPLAPSTSETDPSVSSITESTVPRTEADTTHESTTGTIESIIDNYAETSTDKEDPFIHADQLNRQSFIEARHEDKKLKNVAPWDRRLIPDSSYARSSPPLHYMVSSGPPPSHCPPPPSSQRTIRQVSDTDIGAPTPSTRLLQGVQDGSYTPSPSETDAAVQQAYQKLSGGRLPLDSPPASSPYPRKSKFTELLHDGDRSHEVCLPAAATHRVAPESPTLARSGRTVRMVPQSDAISSSPDSGNSNSTMKVEDSAPRKRPDTSIPSFWRSSFHERMPRKPTVRLDDQAVDNVNAGNQKAKDQAAGKHENRNSWNTHKTEEAGDWETIPGSIANLNGEQRVSTVPPLPTEFLRNTSSVARKSRHARSASCESIVSETGSGTSFRDFANQQLARDQGSVVKDVGARKRVQSVSPVLSLFPKPQSTPVLAGSPRRALPFPGNLESTPTRPVDGTHIPPSYPPRAQRRTSGLRPRGPLPNPSPTMLNRGRPRDRSRLNEGLLPITPNTVAEHSTLVSYQSSISATPTYVEQESTTLNPGFGDSRYPIRNAQTPTHHGIHTYRRASQIYRTPETGRLESYELNNLPTPPPRSARRSGREVLYGTPLWTSSVPTISSTRTFTPGRGPSQFDSTEQLFSNGTYALLPSTTQRRYSLDLEQQRARTQGVRAATVALCASALFMPLAYLYGIGSFDEALIRFTRNIQSRPTACQKRTAMIIGWAQFCSLCLGLMI